MSYMKHSVVRQTTINDMDFTIEAEVDDYWEDNGDGTHSYVKSFLITIKNETTGESEAYCTSKSASDGIEKAIESLKGDYI